MQSSLNTKANHFLFLILFSSRIRIICIHFVFPERSVPAGYFFYIIINKLQLRKMKNKWYLIPRNELKQAILCCLRYIGIIDLESGRDKTQQR